LRLQLIKAMASVLFFKQKQAVNIRLTLSDLIYNGK